MAVNNINLNTQNDVDREALDVINTLADLEDRKPHDSLRRLILEAGNKKIKELQSLRGNNRSSDDSGDNSETNTDCQEES